MNDVDAERDRAMPRRRRKKVYSEQANGRKGGRERERVRVNVVLSLRGRTNVIRICVIDLKESGSRHSVWRLSNSREIECTSRGRRECHRSVVMRSPCAGAALDPPLWIVPSGNGSPP
jgi:hypothetical protein